MVPATHRRAIIPAVGLLLLLLAGSASPAEVAQAGPTLPVFGPLREFDADGNGWLDAGEQRAAADVFTSFADADGDGKLAEGELRHAFTVVMSQPGVSRLALWYDANHDGKLSAGEREAAYAAFKSRLAGLR